MAAKSKGAPIGAEDDLCVPVHVGDEIRDNDGNNYSIDQYGRAKPLSGGNSVPLISLGSYTITRSWQKSEPEKSEEEKEQDLIDVHVHAAGDQRLVDELRSRGWTVTCTKITEKIVYEEVVL